MRQPGDDLREHLEQRQRKYLNTDELHDPAIKINGAYLRRRNAAQTIWPEQPGTFRKLF